MKRYKITMKQAYNTAKNMPTYFDLRKILENEFIKDFVFDSYVSEKYIEELGVRKDIYANTKHLASYNSIWNNGVLKHSAAVYYNPTLVNGSGLMICATLKVQTVVGPYYVIFVDDIFMKMPEWVQDAMLYHEVGHILYGHCEEDAGGFNMSRPNALKRLICGYFGKVQETEILADRFAATMISNSTMATALAWIRMYVKTCDPEINARIKLLEQYQTEEESME